MSFKVIFIVLAVASIAHGSIFMSCEGEKQPVNVKIANCNDEYCEVKRNEVSKMEYTFETVSEATELTAKVRAQVYGVWLPWPLGKLSKVCDNLSNMKCPLPAKTQAIFVFAVTIPPISPVGAKAIIEYKIVDQNKDIVACTRFPVYISA